MNPDKTIKSIASAIPAEFMKDIGAKDISMVSPRSIRWDIPVSPAGVNRIKVTLQENGEWRLRTYRVEELEDVPNIGPDNLMSAIQAIALGETSQ